MDPILTPPHIVKAPAPQAPPTVKKRGRPKTIVKTDVKIVTGPIIVRFD